jgi:hypothetical protein
MPHDIPLPARSSLGRAFGFAIYIVALGLLAGCGAGVGDVNGKVYYKGQVVTSGFVTMVGPDGIPKNSQIAEDGSYQISRVGSGEATITVTSPPPDFSKTQAKRAGPEARKTEDDGSSFTDNQKKTWRELPRAYSDITHPILKCTISSGSNSFDIKLD